MESPSKHFSGLKNSPWGWLCPELEDASLCHSLIRCESTPMFESKNLVIINNLQQLRAYVYDSLCLFKELLWLIESSITPWQLLSPSWFSQMLGKHTFCTLMRNGCAMLLFPHDTARLSEVRTVTDQGGARSRSPCLTTLLGLLFGCSFLLFVSVGFQSLVNLSILVCSVSHSISVPTPLSSPILVAWTTYFANLCYLNLDHCFLLLKSPCQPKDHRMFLFCFVLIWFFWAALEFELGAWHLLGLYFSHSTSPWSTVSYVLTKHILSGILCDICAMVMKQFSMILLVFEQESYAKLINHTFSLNLLLE
jgi:hypothetical protein